MTSSRVSNNPLSDVHGFSLIELVMVIILLGVIGTISYSIVGSNIDSERFETTRQKMEIIREAILGNKSVDIQGHRTHFGYHGDWGSLPSSLSSLVNAEVPSFSYNSTYGFGTGWNGPYVKEAITGSSFSKDGWGRDFVYTPSASPPTLTSLGADGVSGGTGFGKDLTIKFESFERQARVHGYVADGDTRLSGKTVEIRYPVSGVMTAFTITTDGNGYFTFSNLPFGIRSLRVTDSPTLGPQQIVVDSSELEVPVSTLNYFGKLQEVTYVSGTAGANGPGNSHVTSTLKSSYTNSIQVDFVTVSWTGVTGGYLKKMTVNGIRQEIANVSSNTRVDIVATQTMAANSNNNSITLHFANNADGTGNIDMETATLTMTFEWTNLTEKDTVTFSPVNP